MNNHPWLGERVKKLREALGMTQEKFARLVGVTETTVCNWEKNRVHPYLTNAMRLEELEKSSPKRGKG